MTTVEGSRLYEIFEGEAETAEEETIILGYGPTGDATARRRLVHPDEVNFPPILYWKNPDRTWNMDNEALRAPLASVARALEGSQVVRFLEEVADVIITEAWLGSDTEFSLPGFQFRQLYEYLVNPPDWNPAAPEYIQWSPQDRNAKTWNVELIRLAVGSGEPTAMFDVTEFFPAGSGAGAKDPLAELDAAFANENSGLLDRTVTLTMKLVSEV